MKFRVHGFCLVPVQAELEVDAQTADEALVKAMSAWTANKCALIVPGSGDDGAAFDWQPIAEAIGS